jgi:hypothetical protein
MNKLQKPRKSRITSDATPVPVLLLSGTDAASNGVPPPCFCSSDNPCHCHDYAQCNSISEMHVRPTLPCDKTFNCSPGEAPTGHSPRQSSLQKALDKVLKRVGAKDKERPSEAGYVTAEDSETVSRRSSIASLTEPPVALHESHGTAPVEAQDRHRIMPGWQLVSMIFLV